MSGEVNKSAARQAPFTRSLRFCGCATLSLCTAAAFEGEAGRVRQRPCVLSVFDARRQKGRKTPPGSQAGSGRVLRRTRGPPKRGALAGIRVQEFKVRS